MVTQYLYIEWKMKESLDSRFVKDSCVSGKPLVTPCQTARHIHHKLLEYNNSKKDPNMTPVLLGLC